MVAALPVFLLGAVQAYKIQLSAGGGQHFHIFFTQGPGIVGIQKALAVLFDAVEQTLLRFGMGRPEGKDPVAQNRKAVAGKEPVEAEALFFASKAYAGVQKPLLNRGVAKDLHEPFSGMGIGLPQKFQVLRIAVVGMAVGKQQRLHLLKVQSQQQAVDIVFRRQVQQQVLVHKGLGPGADVFPAQQPCLPAQFTIAEHTGPGFPGRGAVISNFHFSLL